MTFRIGLFCLLMMLMNTSPMEPKQGLALIYQRSPFHVTFPICDEYETTCKTYYVFYDTKMNAKDADDRCKRMGLRLAAVNTAFEYHVLSEYLTKQYNFEEDEFWTSGEKANTGYFWRSRGVPPTELFIPYWSPSYNETKKQFVTEKFEEKCIALKSEKEKLYPDQTFKFELKDSHCDDKKYPICEDLSIYSDAKRGEFINRFRYNEQCDCDSF